jgi:hypothetical protein
MAMHTKAIGELAEQLFGGLDILHVVAFGFGRVLIQQRCVTTITIKPKPKTKSGQQGDQSA